MKPSPSCTKWVNSYTCIPTKNMPQAMVAASQPMSAFRLPRCAPLKASTTNRELNSSSAVPKVTRGISRMGLKCSPEGEVHGSWGYGPTRLLPLLTR